MSTKLQKGILLIALAALCHCAVGTVTNPWSFPTCSAPCYNYLWQNGTCAVDDASCACVQLAANPGVMGCIQQNCLVKEILTSIEISATRCNAPRHDRTQVLFLESYIAGPIAVLCVVLRLLSRPRIKYNWLDMMDDWIMAVNAILVIGLIYINVAIAHEGYGRDIWMIGFDNIRRILKLMYADEIVYAVSVKLTKLSILFFYLRVFPRASFPKLQKYIFGAIAFTIVGIFAFTIPIVFQCSPINYFWDFLDFLENHWAGHCIDINSYGWAHGAYTLVLDLWLLIIPVPELRKLKLPWRKKLKVVFMFAMGGFVTFVSVPRIVSVAQWGASTNPTYDFVYVTFWAVMECYLSVILACLPRINLLFEQIYKHFIPDVKELESGLSGGDLHSSKRSNGVDHPVPLDSRGEVKIDRAENA